jgi:hypothetical protein
MVLGKEVANLVPFSRLNIAVTGHKRQDAAQDRGGVVAVHLGDFGRARAVSQAIRK